MAKLAIVGYSCELAGAEDSNALWNLLTESKSAFEEIPKDRWAIEGFFSTARYEQNKSVSKWMAPINLTRANSRSKARLTSTEKAQIDPQQWLLFDHVERTMQCAGIDVSYLEQYNVSVSVGAMAVDNLFNKLDGTQAIGPETTLGNFQALLANRISSEFGFRGESKTINTACSASLMALSDAERLLTLNRADFSIVAAANLNLHPMKYISFSKAGMLSRKGKCTPFSIDADGYVPGDGVAALLVTTIERATDLGLPIFAVIDSVIGNHNGSRTPSITAPSVDAQVELLSDSLSMAKVEPESISYIEAHGTGTSLGDPIEVDALSRVFSESDVGSIKGVVGHTESVAGLAGIIKVILMMKNKVIPANSWIEALNPLVFERKGKLNFPTHNKHWKQINGIRRAAVSSFGFGGANGHVILSEPVETSSKQRPLPLSDGYYIGYSPSLDKKNIAHVRKPYDGFGDESGRHRYAQKVMGSAIEDVQLSSNLSTVYAKDYLNNLPLFQSLNRPYVIIDHDEETEEISKDVISHLNVGMMYISGKNKVWRLSQRFLNRIEGAQSAIESLSSDWIANAQELEKQQFTYNVLMSKWRKVCGAEHTNLAYVFAALELYDKWGLSSDHISSSLKTIYLVIKEGVVTPEQLFGQFNDAQSLIRLIANGYLEYISESRTISKDLLSEISSKDEHCIDVKIDFCNKIPLPQDGDHNHHIMKSWLDGNNIHWNKIPQKYLTSIIFT
ncbi:Ketoacyl-synthetase-like protein [Vibrio crassostreae]|uniref:beta-ketoacyl [acyl carrier protein] synthase domain-containing protein n=1 Tax=Vibrio TaxID=662 RepID=UPI000EFC7DFF|nr:MULTISPECIES: polyketide synthase [Vibrio]TCN77971.1 ketoacyl-synthetase-like protein [Vibrio crassostreae]CAK2508456.1 Ketoacyl-synthetase-like protein [Vibrio crassostreae]CAK2512372.1 Ketoacyl-synthetase-like protein [Vibrio crassostreae]CAK3854954.1 Ketoacyl-synthetase-like protein [Vibrio crassostreae]CAK3988390.1 Ketoacyl-synthetase-like protein [Vibrio crassostreae]